MVARQMVARQMVARQVVARQPTSLQFSPTCNLIRVAVELRVILVARQVVARQPQAFYHGQFGLVFLLAHVGC